MKKVLIIILALSINLYSFGIEAIYAPSIFNNNVFENRVRVITENIIFYNVLYDKLNEELLEKQKGLIKDKMKNSLKIARKEFYDLQAKYENDRKFKQNYDKLFRKVNAGLEGNAIKAINKELDIRTKDPIFKINLEKEDSVYKFYNAFINELTKPQIFPKST